MHSTQNLSINNGISQTVIGETRSHYSFQMICGIYIQSTALNRGVVVRAYSINSNNEKILISENEFDIDFEIKNYNFSFTSLNDTKEIEINICSKLDASFDFIFTNTKLEKHPIPTEWELAIEDIQDALDNKVGNTHEEIFNSLTDDGKMQGIYVDIDEHGRKNFYFNATYIKSGKLLGDYIDAKNLKVVKDNGDVTLNIDSKGNVDIKARKMQILVSNDETEEEEFEDAAGVSDIA